MIVDTDVLIWYFRGNENARVELLGEIPFSISCITLMELLQGTKNKREQENILKQLQVWGTTILQITENISARALQSVKEFFLSLEITIADALIAATAYDQKAELFTANTRHFEFVPGLRLRKFNP